MEKSLGVTLFRRVGHGVKATPEGMEYAREVRIALGVLDSATDMFVSAAKEKPVRIALQPMSAHNWLVPRLQSLYDTFPDRAFDIVYSDRPSEDYREEIDFAIDWGNENLAREKGGHVFAPRQATVIASKKYFEKHGLPKEPADLSRYRILENLPSLHEWRMWLENFHSEGDLLPSRHRFSSSALMIEAVRRGFGVGLACRNLLSFDIAAGELITPFSYALRTGETYYLIVMPRMRDESMMRTFLSWALAST
jgi:LysR family glycine cleavage system transcriptional activator